LALAPDILWGARAFLFSGEAFVTDFLCESVIFVRLRFFTSELRGAPPRAEDESFHA
jgi:hypothetical protein